MSDTGLLLSDRFVGALQFAAERHREHWRKGTSVPYISHLLQVAGLVLEYGGSETEAIAALLHDVVEDQKAAIDEVRDRFGDAVTEIVLGCSDSTVSSGPKEEYYPRKSRYIQHVRAASESTRLVSACDKLHNARALLQDYRRLGDALFDRFTADKATTFWYYFSLIDAFRAAGTNPTLINELERTVAELARLAYAAPERENT